VTTTSSPSGIQGWRLIAIVFPPRELQSVASFDRLDPDALATTAVGDEDDAAAVGAEARLAVQAHSPGNRGCLASGNRQRVEIARQVVRAKPCDPRGVMLNSW
jgi:hypothetical protein